ncbi:MAG: hypothetical protein ISS95_01525 [Candidatus Aenigmarchaeota archaeon]|nr:hypothetical protein [Candidatus Aenigmarchaeota archaeon]
MRKRKDNISDQTKHISNEAKGRKNSKEKPSSICLIGVSDKKPSDMILLEGAKKMFKSVLFIPISSIRLISESGKIFVKYRQTDLSKFDSILIRVPESKYKTAKTILDNIPEHVFKVQNAASFVITSDRLLLCQKLAKAGINVPKVCFADSAEAASRSFSELRFPILVRVPFDKEKLMLARNKNEAKAMMDTLESLNQSIFLEEYYTDVELLQVFVVGGKIIGTLKRKTTDIGYRKGTVSSANPSGRIKRTAKHACKVIEADFARIDILNLPDPVVVDVSISPLLDTFAKFSKNRIGERIFERISYLNHVKKGGAISKFMEELKLTMEDILGL